MFLQPFKPVCGAWKPLHSGAQPAGHTLACGLSCTLHGNNRLYSTIHSFNLPLCYLHSTLNRRILLFAASTGPFVFKYRCICNDHMDPKETHVGWCIYLWSTGLPPSGYEELLRCLQGTAATSFDLVYSFESSALLTQLFSGDC